VLTYTAQGVTAVRRYEEQSAFAELAVSKAFKQYSDAVPGSVKLLNAKLNWLR
jgi:hypothetical protein